jgi:hypothetical protein
VVGYCGHLMLMWLFAKRLASARFGLVHVKKINIQQVYLTHMSSNEIIPFITEGYGLSDEDLDEIILRENLKDVSEGYSTCIRRIQDRLHTKLRMRILEFGERSGSSIQVKLFFRQLILANRHLFYNHIYSNRDCGVVLMYSGLKDKNSELFFSRLLPHEFAHHYQLVEADFPLLLPRGAPSDLHPQFALSAEIGPLECDILVDALLLTEARIHFFKDFSERISDFVCEGILVSNGFTEGMFDEYLEIDTASPIKDIPRDFPSYRATIKYLSRLALRDEAEWHALLKSIYGTDFTNSKLQLNKKRVLKLNKDLADRKQIFRKIFDISLKTNYHDFRRKEKAVDYIKRVSNLLNIEVRTIEKW